MAGFHLPRDPHIPNQGNGGWIDVEPADDPVVPIEEDFEEDFQEDADSESKAYNPPQVAQNPNPRIISMALRHVGSEPRLVE